jgi:transposase InsO family protein
MDEKVQMIGDYLKKEHMVTELGKHYQVSRKTVYKWIRRYQVEGIKGLQEGSHAPFKHPNATCNETASEIIITKRRYDQWGPKKIITWLQERRPDKHWPAVSTTQAILRKEGLVQTRKYRRHTPPYTHPFQQCSRPNDSWSIDYKGQFRTGDGRLCYPLTITDNYSRYLLSCRGLRHPSHEATRPLLERAFREYGLPLAIRSDNGAPFASSGLGGLSRLAVWLIRLQIRPERIALSCPEQNGRHERMHRSLKAAVCQPPANSLYRQQLAFDRFIAEYNEERPHEGLGMKTPASLYQPSNRHYPQKLPKIEYDDWLTVRKVLPSGGIKWCNHYIYVSQALAGEPVGLKQITETAWEIWYSFLRLGMVDATKQKVLPITPV